MHTRSMAVASMREKRWKQAVLGVVMALAIVFANTPAAGADAANAETEQRAEARDRQSTNAGTPSSSIDIPAGTLAEALSLLAKQTGADLVYRPDQVAGLKTSGLKGQLTTAEAINALLKGTDLRSTTSAAGAYMIAAPKREAGVNPSAKSGPESSSNGNAQSCVGPSGGNPDSTAALNKTGLEGCENENSAGNLALARAQGEHQGASNPNSAEDSSESTKIEEIVVTAQKREERLQDVPISMSVLSGSELDGSTFQGVREAMNTVPGISIATNQNDSPTVTVRGMAPVAARFGGTGVSAYYLDTIPFSLVKHAVVPDANAYDLERIEALRGPQGTLYGASALNGVLRVLTKDADPDEFELKARGMTSSTENGDWNLGGDLAVNVPLVEGKLAARAVVGYQDMSGWIDRPNHENANDSETKNFRLKVNAKPTDQLSIGMSAWRSRVRRGSQATADEIGENPNLIDEPNQDDFDAYGLKIGYEFSRFSLVSMTSNMKYFVESNLDATPYGFPTLLVVSIDADVFSQELLLNSTHGGPWRWSIGAMYRDEKDDLISDLPEFSLRLDDYQDLSESYAVYGEITRTFFNGKFEVTGGARYFEDDVQLKDALRPQSPSSTFDAVSPRVVLAWHPSNDLMVYSSYAEGFRSGSQQDAYVAAAGVPPTRPDTLKNYELGAKGNLLDGRLSFDAALYYMDWQDAQLGLLYIVETPAGDFPFGALINSTSSSGMGIDLGVTVRPVDRLSLDASVSRNDLGIDEDVVSGGLLFWKKGDRPASPKLTFGASASYAFPLGGSGFEGRFSISANYISESCVDNRNSAVVEECDSQLLSRAGFSVQAPTRWTATLYGDNLNNENARIFGTGLEHLNLYSRPRPRTVGLQVEYHF